MKIKKKTKTADTFKTSLLEGLKYAKGEKSKVKVENIPIKVKLTKYDQEILDAYEKGELKTVKNFESEKKRITNNAKAFMKKDYRINIRISKQDLNAIQAKAMEEGLPYQTFISSVIHKVAHGKAVHHP